MPSCSVVVCKKNSTKVNFKNDGISFHWYPKDPKIKEKWIKATGKGPNWFPTEHSTICSRHFEPTCFQPLKNAHRLFEWAVPTLKLYAVLADNQSDIDSNKDTEDHILAPSPKNLKDTPHTRKLRRTITAQEELIKNQKLKINLLQKQNSRYRKQIASLKEVLSQTKNKNNIEDEL